jgi:hypothetical protein
VRLTQEELNNIKETVNYKNPLVKDLFDTIEAQQQDIEQVQKCYHITNQSRKEQIHANKRQEKAIRNMKAYMYDKEKEIEQLQAQAATMRGTLLYAKSNGYSFDTIELIDKALSLDAGKDYHNPADVEALNKLTDDFAALNSLYNVENETFTEIVQKEKELLKEIDRKDTALERAREAIINHLGKSIVGIAGGDDLRGGLAAIEKALGGKDDGV